MIPLSTVIVVLNCVLIVVPGLVTVRGPLTCASGMRWAAVLMGVVTRVLDRNSVRSGWTLDTGSLPVGWGCVTTL